MRNLVYILFFVCISASSQKVTQTEYFNLLDSDSVFISQHSTWRGGYNNAMAQLASKEIDTFFIRGDWTRIIINHKNELIFVRDSELNFVAVSAASTTPTSAKIFIELSTTDYQYGWILYRKEGDITWQETDRNKSVIYSNTDLIPNSNYEYQVFAVDNQGKEIKSMLLTFKTQ